MFHPIGLEGTLAFRAMSLGHLQITVATVSFIVGVPYLLSTKMFAVLQDMFKYFDDTHVSHLAIKHVRNALQQFIQDSSKLTRRFEMN